MSRQTHLFDSDKVYIATSIGEDLYWVALHHGYIDFKEKCHFITGSKKEVLTKLEKDVKTCSCPDCISLKLMSGLE